MNFVTIADVHFDIPFTTLSDRSGMGEERRLDQRKAFKNAIEYVKQNNISNIFIVGDLYEDQYIKTSTIEYINNLFKEISNTKIYITPGNHDPYTKTSFYNTYNWAENVKIFTEKVEIIETEEADIYGQGFNDFQKETSEINDIQIKNPNKINILVTHGDLYNQTKYNPINLNQVKSKFDYIAIGHIHKRDEIYPGSLISLGFDELGEHGFIAGNVTQQKQVATQFIKADEKELIKSEIDITQIASKEELIEKLNEIETLKNLYEITLVGYRNFEINIDLKLIQKNIIKIKDLTKVQIQINKNQNTLSGIFQKKLEEKLENNEINQETFQKIYELQNKIMGR